MENGTNLMMTVLLMILWNNALLKQVGRKEDPSIARFTDSSGNDNDEMPPTDDPASP
jgi:hypothetical protein